MRLDKHFRTSKKGTMDKQIGMEGVLFKLRYFLTSVGECSVFGFIYLLHLGKQRPLNC